MFAIALVRTAELSRAVWLSVLERLFAAVDSMTTESKILQLVDVYGAFKACLVEFEVKDLPNRLSVVKKKYGDKFRITAATHS